MKKILIGSIITCNALFGTIIVPDISVFDNCQQRDKISQLEPKAELGVIQNWFEKANKAEESHNLNLMSYLVKPRTTLKIKTNLMYLLNAVKSQECTQEVIKIESNFDLEVSELKKMIRNPSRSVEHTTQVIELQPQIIIQEIKPIEVIKPTVIDDSYYAPYESKTSKLYIVSARKGVNIRDNPLLGKKSKVIDSLPYATGLIFRESVLIGINEKWGQFVYQKNGSKHIGWIHMSYVKQGK